MAIGMKPRADKTERQDPILAQSDEIENNASGVPDNVANSPQMQQVAADKAVSSLKKESAVDHTPAVSGAKRNTIILIVAVVVFIIIAAILINFMNTKKENATPVIDDGTPAVESQGTEEGSADEGALSSLGIGNSADSTTSDNPNAVYDENGNLISENGIYDQDGNIISDKQDIIDPGNAYTTTEAESTTTTSATVYSANDFIKDLNGLDISAVYNVKSISYVHDYANYEKKRAIMDQGMELYWFELTYKGLKYRMQVCYDDYKNFDDMGIVQVNLEVLNLEGGEKVISFAEVAHNDESNQ